MSNDNDTRNAWEFQEKWARGGIKDSIVIIDLRARVEALESALTPRPPLSPAAQAVMDAADDAIREWPPIWEAALAAALRAAADQVISPMPPPCGDFDDYAEGFLAAHLKYRNELLALAAELEGTANG